MGLGLGNGGLEAGFCCQILASAFGIWRASVSGVSGQGFRGLSTSISESTAFRVSASGLRVHGLGIKASVSAPTVSPKGPKVAFKNLCREALALNPKLLNPI